MTCGRKRVYVHDGEERVSKWEIVERETSVSDVPFTNEPLFWIGLNQFTARAAQIYKLLNQISLSDAWQSLRLEMRHSSGVSDHVMMNGSSNSPWTEETARLEPKTDEPLIFSSVNRTLEWRDQMNVFMASHRWCKKARWWRLVSSLYTCKTFTFTSLLGVLTI